MLAGTRAHASQYPLLRARGDACRQLDPAVHHRRTADAEATLAKADEIVQQMELEARSGAKGPEGRDLQSRAKACKSEVNVLRSSLKQAASSAPARSDVGGSSGDEAADDQRARLLRMGDRMQEGTGKLQQAHRVMIETEAIGESILGDLRSQRETMMHASGTLQRANEGLARSKRTLAAISRRALGNMLIMWGMELRRLSMRRLHRPITDMQVARELSIDDTSVVELLRAATRSSRKTCKCGGKNGGFLRRDSWTKHRDIR